MKNNPARPMAVLGAGSFGTALALHLAREGQPVRLWAHEEDSIIAMQNERVNTRYMPGFPFPETLAPIVSLEETVSGIRDILVVVPSIAFRDVLIRLKPHLAVDTRIVWATKGLDAKTGQLLHDVAMEVLGHARAYAVISGPSFAREVAAALPTAVVAASSDPVFAEDLVARFNHPPFRVYSSSDVTGVETGGVVKNVLAIATGISDGMQFGANARSALITRGLAEMMRFGVALGGQPETFMGLAGIGDLVLTCTDNQSRNRRFGLALGLGKSVSDAGQEIGQVVEGRRNAPLIMKLAQQHGVEMPIVEAVCAILNGTLTPVEAMYQLLSREPGTEY
ncbi:MAG TPA: NAD(P)H-dependent glycerol-3-phosphate dehydrogenase [Gammaproteobacteria bacterium]|nr:NAD(P)H-dependent glycerol-3-phosphate dehydrogenase [Gammaproteobacteria bacterium]